MIDANSIAKRQKSVETRKKSSPGSLLSHKNPSKDFFGGGEGNRTTLNTTNLVIIDNNASIIWLIMCTNITIRDNTWYWCLGQYLGQILPWAVSATRYMYASGQSDSDICSAKNKKYWEPLHLPRGIFNNSPISPITSGSGSGFFLCGKIKHVASMAPSTIIAIWSVITMPGLDSASLTNAFANGLCSSRSRLPIFHARSAIPAASIAARVTVWMSFSSLRIG